MPQKILLSRCPTEKWPKEPCMPRLGIRALYYLDMTDDDEFNLGVARLAAQLREPPDRKPAAT